MQTRYSPAGAATCTAPAGAVTFVASATAGAAGAPRSDPAETPGRPSARSRRAGQPAAMRGAGARGRKRCSELARVPEARCRIDRDGPRDDRLERGLASTPSPANDGRLRGSTAAR